VDDLEQPPRGYTTGDVASQAAPPPRRKRSRLKWIVAAVVAVPIVLFALYTWIALSFSYSHGERAGYVQKFSKKGWICKTWEGEIAMANLPGTMPQIFNFTVRDDAVARRILKTMGNRVVLSYDQHKGVPTSCFGETEYYVTDVQPAAP
jgi:hypothetical protein